MVEDGVLEREDVRVEEAEVDSTVELSPVLPR